MTVLQVENHPIEIIVPRSSPLEDAVSGTVQTLLELPVKRIGALLNGSPQLTPLLERRALAADLSRIH